MSNDAKPPKYALGTGLGMLAVLITRELGGAVAVIGGLTAGFAALVVANSGRTSDAWPFYLISGGVFVAIAVVCRWNPRE